MATTAIHRQYAKAIFIDHTRTLNSVPASLKDGVKEWAGTSHANANYAPTIYLEDINNALAAGTITQAQYDELLAEYPDIPTRPVYTAAPAAEAEDWKTK
jgi:hypothetical protein